MTEITVQVTNKLGLHAEPATSFVSLANSFNTSIWVEKNGRRINGKSLLGIFSLGILAGDTIKIIVDGEDEENALNSLKSFIKNISD